MAIPEPTVSSTDSLPGERHADLIDRDMFGSGDPGDGLGDRCVDRRAADRGGQERQGEPGDPHAVVDDLVRQRFDEVGLPGPAGARDGEVLRAADPLQRGQPGLGAGWDGGVGPLLEQVTGCKPLSCSSSRT